MQYQISKKEIRTKTPPFYSVNDDNFYHGPAWVIKPRLFPPKDISIETPGPAYYHIPERSIYSRPGTTIGSRYETISPISTSLLGHYYPNDEYTSKNKMPAVLITPRGNKHKKKEKFSGCLYSPSEPKYHCRVPLLRPLYSPKISRRKKQSICPGPATYPIYKMDREISSPIKPGFTQKHRFLFNQQLLTLQAYPPFYSPIIIDRIRLPSFTIGKRLSKLKKSNLCAPPSYNSFDKNNLCSNRIQPGVTLKGRWNPLVYNGVNNISKDTCPSN